MTKTQDEELAILLECDSTVTDSIQKHLKVYKIRRKVNISPCTDLALWAVLPSPSGQDAGAVSPELLSPTAAVVWDEDPRTKAMGWRLVTDKNIRLPESVSDLPPGVMLPLEANLVYMQGISFSKGCYLGQELTARTHHTGVIRKRLMPVCLSAPPDQGPPQGGMPLVTRAGKPAGKHLCTLGDRGLSLVRLDYAKEPLVLQNPGGTAVTVEASVPDWWPADSKGS
ncbi:hypothetical protein Z043_107300 [Scleropages formosus]|uniref:CAF17 C-terminal domain-containing protein n=1 Tax=Scleropages formosus TaxID=113540 RepID=A0A0P7VJ03_SCLFO|nr:hypothetical protein Z043_107300 [Scleropages formosus]